MANTNFDAILSTTLANYRDTLEDNLSKNVPLWHFLKKEGRVNRKGGEKAVEQIMFGKNPNSKTYSDYETLDLTPAEGISAAEYPWKQHAVTVAISGMEEAKNEGKHAVIDLLQSKIEQAETTAIDDFDVMFWSETVGNSGKDFNGLGLLIGDENSTVTTVGGIDCTDPDGEFWQSFVERTAGTLSVADMTDTYLRAVRGTDRPKFGATTLELWQAYNNALQANQRFTDAKTAEAGFHNLLFQGAPLLWGDNVPEGTMTFVNPKYLRLAILGDNLLRAGKFDSPSDLDARYAKILTKGQLTTSNRRLAGSRLEGRTA